jgi:hypothetical protein
MGTNPDQWIADVASYVRNAWGNRAPLVAAADVARVRAATSSRKSAWTTEEIDALLPRAIVVDDQWKLTASHNAASASKAVTLAPWTTGAPQQPGMWLQVELPHPVKLTEVQFDSESAVGRGAGFGGAGGRGAAAGRGGGGRGVVPPPAGGAPGDAPVAPQGAQPVPGGPGTLIVTTPQSPTTFDAAATAGAYPRGYQVQVSMDGTTWSAPVAQGRGSRSTIASFAPVEAKFVRITQTSSVDNAPPWAVMLLRLYEASPATSR